MDDNAKPLRVALITNNYTPYSGGVVSSINAQVAALQQKGHRVHIITLDFLGERHQDPAHVIRIQTPIKFMCRGNHYAIPWFMRIQLSHALKSIKAEIVHVHHPFLLGPRVRDVVRKLGLPIVFTYHTLYEEYGYHVPLPAGLAKALIRRLVRRFCASVDGIIVPGPCVSRHLETLGVDARLQCIPSLLQPMFRNIPQHVRGTVRSPVRLLCVVRYTREKNIPFLFNACRLLDIPFHLSLVGYGVEYFKLREYAYDQLKLTKQQVTFVVKPAKDQLLDLYRQADLFLFPSRTDTQGLVLIEAMACSNPVIALNGPAQGDIIVQEKNGLLVENETEMAEAIKYLSSHPEIFQSMQKEAWMTSRNYLAEDEYVARLVNMYRWTIAETANFH